MSITVSTFNELVNLRGTIRSGIIPYGIDENNDIYWLMGTPTYDYDLLSDFGGGCKTGRGENGYQCALRELNEESSGLLTEPVRNVIQAQTNLIKIWRYHPKNNPTVNQFLTFVPIDFSDYPERFIPNKEVAAIDWYHESELIGPDVEIKGFHQPIRRFIKYFKTLKESPTLPPTPITPKIRPPVFPEGIPPISPEGIPPVTPEIIPPITPETRALLEREFIPRIGPPPTGMCDIEFDPQGQSIKLPTMNINSDIFQRYLSRRGIRHDAILKPDLYYGQYLAILYLNGQSFVCAYGSSPYEASVNLLNTAVKELGLAL